MFENVKFELFFARIHDGSNFVEKFVQPLLEKPIIAFEMRFNEIG